MSSPPITCKMGNTPTINVDQKRSRRKFTICEAPEFRNGTAALFATEPKFKCDNVRMYHIYKIIETGSCDGQAKEIAIFDYINVCNDITFVKRSNVDGML